MRQGQVCTLKRCELFVRTTRWEKKGVGECVLFQANPGPGNTIPTPMPTTGTQGGILMSQTNTMAMGGGQITQNVISNNASPQTLSTTVPQTQMNMQVILMWISNRAKLDLSRLNLTLHLQNSGISGPQANTGTGGMIAQQRPPFDDLEIARHQNLLKIQHLRQTLEAAQQQEAQYKSQLEVNVSKYGFTLWIEIIFNYKFSHL